MGLVTTPETIVSQLKIINSLVTRVAFIKAVSPLENSRRRKQKDRIIPVTGTGCSEFFTRNENIEKSIFVYISRN